MLNPFGHARFLMSCASLVQCPRDEQPELAFAGRSNAGKSSALNALCGQKALARVSKTPGRTQLINLFDLPGGGRLADLPGYGFAQVPDETRRDWARMVGQYVERRTSLRGLVLIMDARHPLTPLDRQLLAWVRASARPCHILLSKADKLAFGAAQRTLAEVRKQLAVLDVTAGVQLFSAHSGQGVDEARSTLATLLGLVPAAGERV